MALRVRTVFFGTPALAVPSLAALAESHEVTAVVCQPDKPQGRSKKLVAPPVKVWAEEHGIPVCQAAKLNDGVFEAWLREQAPEVCTVAAYGRLLKAPILAVPRHGFVNMHPSLLPRWRGPSPIQAALISGDRETGVSIMRVVLDMDAGDVMLQEKTPIAPDENAVVLGERLAEMGAGMLVEAVGLAASGGATYTPQNDAEAVYCKLLRKEDGRIRWGESAQRIHDLVRGAVPWPMAHCRYRGEVCRIYRTRVVDEEAGAEAGAVVGVGKDRIEVATGERRLAVTVLQLPGKKPVAVEAFLRGHAVEVGERFEDIV